ncbi:MAG: hypothetical protein KAS17_05560 [Victivallaceae bacterium]|nr:hypothetical protein [Victivallaceae bacterium]
MPELQAACAPTPKLVQFATAKSTPTVHSWVSPGIEPSVQWYSAKMS